jgi:malonate decarboxylase beta subunit
MMTSVPYHELKARERIAAIADAGTFDEILTPPDRVMSAFLPQLGIPVSFDDGLVIGRAAVGGKRILLAAQVGQFVGGSVGEVHSAKLVGLLRAAARDRVPCVLLVESGGVRLHEGSSGEIGIAEAIRAVFACRAAGAPVIAVIGSDIGAYGGMGILSACCDVRVITEHGRMSISGPIVIEKWMGKAAFDSADRALIWKTSGGKTRWLLGDAEVLVDDHTASVREGILDALARGAHPDVTTIETRQRALEERLAKFSSSDAEAIWRACGVTDIAAATLATASEFVSTHKGGLS